MYRIVSIFVSLLLTATVAYADIEDAHAAFDRGRYAEAFRLYQGYAEQGERDAQYALGVLYYDGKGVAADLRQAAHWMQKAAERGLPEAQLFLGTMYFEGEGVKQDYEAAVKWYARAAARGSVDAQYNMGYMYEFGLGVSIDCDKAAEWYGKAADQGDEEAREILDSFSCREYAHVASAFGDSKSGDIIPMSNARRASQRRPA